MDYIDYLKEDSFNKKKVVNFHNWGGRDHPKILTFSQLFFASSNSSKSLKGVEYRPILGTLMVIWLECSDTVWTVKAQLIHVRNSRQ